MSGPLDEVHSCYWDRVRSQFPIRFELRLTGSAAAEGSPSYIAHRSVRIALKRLEQQAFGMFLILTYACTPMDGDIGNQDHCQANSRLYRFRVYLQRLLEGSPSLL